MARQDYEKNLEDLNNFPWSNLMKLITGETMQQFLRNWLDSAAEGLLLNGQTIEEAIEELRTSGGGDGNVFSRQFKTINDAIWWDPAYFAAEYAVTPPPPETETVYRLTATQNFNTNDFIPIAEVARDPQTFKFEFINYDIRLFNNVGVDINDNQVCYVTYDIGTLPTLPTNVPPLSEDFEYISHKWIAPGQTATRIVINLGTGETEGNINTIGIGSIIDFRKVELQELGGGLLDGISLSASGGWTIEEIEVPVEGSSGSTPEANNEELLKGTRVQHLMLTQAGQIPTIPNVTDPYEEGWLRTDIMPGEIAWNIVDNIWYTSDGTNIISFSGGGGGGPSATVPLSTPSAESPSGAATNVAGALTELTTQNKTQNDSLQAINDALANLADASMKLDNFIETIPTTEERILYFINTASDNTDLVDYNYDAADPDNNYFQLKKANFRYQLLGYLNVKSTGAGDKKITFRLRSQEDDSELAIFPDIEVDGGVNKISSLLLGPEFIDTIADNTNVYLTYQCDDDELDVLVGYATITVRNHGGTNIVIDDIPTKNSPNAVASGGVYKTIKQNFSVVTANEAFEYSQSEAYKITSIVAESGLTVSVKLANGTDYTPGDPLPAFDKLYLSGDTVNKLFTINGEVL